MKAKRAIKTPNQWQVTFGLTKYSLKASLRNKASYFFSLVFPLVFILVFGLFGSGDQRIKLGILDTLSSENTVYQTIERLANQETAPVELIKGTEAELRAKLNQDKVASIIGPSNNPSEVTLITSNGNPQGAAASESFLRGIVSQMNLQAAGVTQPTFSFAPQEISGKSYRYIDFILPGQIGFSILSIATFGIAFTLITLRKTLVLKRMFATTVTPLTFVISQCLSRSVQALLQTLVLLAVGVAAFHFTLAHGWLTVLEMLILSFLGILAFLGFGILISNLAKDEQSLPIALNLFNLPQMLLAGVFFPIDGLPQWVQHIGNNLPLAYLNIALRKVSIEGLTLPQTWPYMLGLFAWSAVAYFLAARTFKAE